jgi:F0F1-type ATP synthase alpha subunit
LFCV